MTLDNELLELVSLGKLEREITLGGFKIKISSLDGEEEHEVIKETSGITDTFERFDKMRRETLVRAIRTINGKSLSLEMKRELLSKLQTSVIAFLQQAYDEMMKEQASIIEELKKK
jgi:uncharacterized coiled-coil DUF342 family protein